MKEILTKYSLRGFDAIHLASSILIQKQLKQKITFLPFDQKQNEVAKLEKFELAD